MLHTYPQTQPSLQQIMKTLIRKTGPFMFIELDGWGFSSIPTGPNGVKRIRSRDYTVSKKHNFVSFYKTKAMRIRDAKDKIYKLPKYALVIVPAGIEHSWIASCHGDGLLGSVDTRHEKEVLACHTSVCV